MKRFSQQQQGVLSELEKTSKDFWNISSQTANFLNMLIKISGAKKGLEVGTSNGYSGIWLASAFKEAGGHLTTIEFYENRINLALENFKKCSLENFITIKQGSAKEVLKAMDEEFDFVFLDADKSEYIKYFDIISPGLRKGAIITADNVISHSEKVAPFVEKIKADPDYQVQILNLPSGLLVAYKVNNI